MSKLEKLEKNLERDSDDVEDLSVDKSSSKEHGEKNERILIKKAGNETEKSEEGKLDLGSDGGSTTTKAPNTGTTLIGSVVLLVISLIITH